MKSLDLAICIPTRGTLFTAVIQSVQANIRESHLRTEVFVTNGEPTPEVFNQLVHTAKAHGAKAILFVEEDTVPPEECIDSMYKALFAGLEIGAVCVEYPVKGGWSTVVHLSHTGTILYCGLGCTMIKMSVFQGLSEPWIHNDLEFSLNKKQWQPVSSRNPYGLYDVLFFTRLRTNHFEIVQIPGKCSHLELFTPAEKEQNSSIHQIREKSDSILRSEIPIDPMLYWQEKGKL